MKYTFVNKASKNKDTVAVILTTASSDVVARTFDGRMVIEIGIGKREDMTRRKLITTIRKIVSLAKSVNKKKVSLNFFDFVFPHLHMLPAELGEMLSTNFEMANCEFVKYKTKPKEGWNTLAEVVVVGKIGTDVERVIKKGRIVGESVNNVRALANTPGGEMTPAILAREATEAAEGLPITVSVLGVREMEELGMGAILGVGRGSDEEPKFIVMEYFNGAPEESPIVLVGKGVTFDTGGLNLKSDTNMYEMHMDMSGGAAVIHSIVLAAKLKLKKNIVALVPAVENMPSGSSYHPGDVLKSMSGKTIEVLNTDAEGRVILADALHYAKKYKPRLVVDVATLTGAIHVALGNYASGLFTRSADLENQFRALGEETGDYVWPMPLWDEYESEIKGTFGDWANTGKGRHGGASNAAFFLYQFTKDEKGKEAYPWVHLDIASRMTSTDGEYLAKGAAGAPMRLLAKLLERY
ncbi:MAG: leucyl aminopeptidase family protein [bacterium]|nr:leucyl aminopeptidase family protein [bacterium]